MNKKIFSNLVLSVVSFFVVPFVFLFFSPISKAAGTGAVAISSATIHGGSVNIVVSASDLPDSDDGVYYLYAEKVYQNGPAGAALAALPIGASVTFQVPLNANTVDSRL